MRELTGGSSPAPRGLGGDCRGQLPPEESKTLHRVAQMVETSTRFPPGGDYGGAHFARVQEDTRIMG